MLTVYQSNESGYSGLGLGLGLGNSGLGLGVLDLLVVD